MSEPDVCPCGGGSYAECCGPFLAGDAQPATAEALMRSRYSAYVLQKIDYLTETHDPETVDEFDEEEAAGWAKGADWQGLEIVDRVRGKEKDNEGVVEFVARYRYQDNELSHHERSSFVKLDGRWYYTSGDPMTAPIKRETPKVGRNDPCPCGSGKKHKKCCGSVGR